MPKDEVSKMNTKRLMDMKRQVYLLTLLGTPLLALCGTFNASAPAQQKSKDKAAPLPLPFKLTGDGHACSGYFHLSHQQMVWKSSFSVCRASNWSSSNDNGTWLFTLKPMPAEEKSCSIRVVQMRKSNPNVDASPWEITGYASIEQLRQHPEQPMLDCSSMQ